MNARRARGFTLIEVILATVLLASGSVKDPIEPRSMTFCFSVTTLIDGCTCRMMLFSSSICGVISRAIPEKKGCNVIEGVVTFPVPDVVVVELTLVTKNSSDPTLSTAF